MPDAYPVTLPCPPWAKRYTSRVAAVAQLRADARCRPSGWNAGAYNARADA